MSRLIIAKNGKTIYRKKITAKSLRKCIAHTKKICHWWIIVQRESKNIRDVIAVCDCVREREKIPINSFCNLLAVPRESNRWGRCMLCNFSFFSWASHAGLRRGMSENNFYLSTHTATAHSHTHTRVSRDWYIGKNFHTNTSASIFFLLIFFTSFFSAGGTYSLTVEQLAPLAALLNPRLLSPAVLNPTALPSTSLEIFFHLFHSRPSALIDLDGGAIAEPKTNKNISDTSAASSTSDTHTGSNGCALSNKARTWEWAKRVTMAIGGRWERRQSPPFFAWLFPAYKLLAYAHDTLTSFTVVRDFTLVAKIFTFIRFYCVKFPIFALFFVWQRQGKNFQCSRSVEGDGRM